MKPRQCSRSGQLGSLTVPLAPLIELAAPQLATSRALCAFLSSRAAPAPTVTLSTSSRSTRFTRLQPPTRCGLDCAIESTGLLPLPATSPTTYPHPPTMTKRRQLYPASRTRATQKLTGASRKLAASLNFDAEFSIQYASAWLERAGSLRVCASGVVRRAVIAYALSLDTADAADELRALRRACTASEVADDARLMAELRLAAVPLDEPLPSLYEVKVGPAAIAAMEDFEARVEATVSIELARLIPRRKVKA